MVAIARIGDYVFSNKVRIFAATHTNDYRRVCVNQTIYFWRRANHHVRLRSRVRLPFTGHLIFGEGTGAG